MKKILICSDSFKGTLSSKEISSIANSLVNDKYKKHIDLASLLIADGGEGSLEAFKSIVNGKYEFIDTIDSENNKIIAPYLLFDNDKAIIEVSKVIGLPLIKNSIEKTKRTTKGLGILINVAIKKLAINAYKSKINGVICSGLDSKMIKENTSVDFLVVSPGIRYPDSNSDDQHRICTPKMAKENGCDYIVVGRLITKSTNPLEMYKKVVNDFMGEN